MKLNVLGSLSLPFTPHLFQFTLCYFQYTMYEISKTTSKCGNSNLAGIGNVLHTKEIFFCTPREKLLFDQIVMPENERIGSK
jgi:hypothetical protein